MKSKLKLLVIIGSATCAVLLLALGFLLYREISRLGVVKKNVDTRNKELQAFYQRDPFPSPENVDKFRKNCADLDKEMTLLVKRMGKGQIQMKADKEPLEWLTMLTKMQKDLGEKARDDDVALAATAASFGFGKYGEGTPPARADVPRLTLQVKIVDAVCKLLYSAGIKELLSIDREPFEGMGEPVPVEGATAEAAAAAAGETNVMKTLFSMEKLTLSFKAKETALINVMNSFASAEMLIVVTGVWMQGAQGVTLEVPAVTATPSAAAKPVVESDLGLTTADTAPSTVALAPGEIDPRPRDQRVVSGQSKENPAKITLTINVYRFVAGDATAGEPQAAPAAATGGPTP